MTQTVDDPIFVPWVTFSRLGFKGGNITQFAKNCIFIFRDTLLVGRVQSSNCVTRNYGYYPHGNFVGNAPVI